jgi:pimeloyl-ACP methyl ester carboxylesterase
MPKIRKIIGRALLGLVALLVVAAVAALVYRSHRQTQVADLMRIQGARGIDEGRFIEVHGTSQWISIRGQDRDNPVILFLHGGPGGANAPTADFLLPLESEFTIVDWDQPGAGRTFGKAGGIIDPSLTIERVAQDGIEVARFAREHLHKDKIVLLAMSWGTLLGVHMAKAQPDLFYAYVGTGQLVATQQNEAMAYSRVLAKARARADSSAIKELEASGPPPYRDVKGFRTQRAWATKYETGSPDVRAIIDRAFIARDYTLRDSVNFVRGFIASGNHFMGAKLDGPLMSYDLRSLGTEFSIPLFIIQGADDDITPADLAKAYVAGVHAPQTQFVAIANSGHDVLWTHTDAFLQEMRSLIRPLNVR